MFNIPDGVWPTMITPYTENNKIDYDCLEELIEWYIKKCVHGLFAVCQSSEMFFLSLEERVELARFVKKTVNGRIPVIASGHISETVEDQIYELKAMADTGIDALVLISGNLASRDEPDCVAKRNIEKIIKEIPDIPLGIYECPRPYKRIVSPELLKWCASTGRFYFLKDTCRNLSIIKNKIESVKDTSLKLFNANAATLLETLKMGAAGYSGVMANFHPELYVWLIENWRIKQEEAEKLQHFLGFSSAIEYQVYPINAKYYLKLEGLNIQLISRSKDVSRFDQSHEIEVKDLHYLSKVYSDRLVH
ncbi:MAG TPA: dihydrodipicolinate synthase family protein [Clostridiaceae bacterium]|nr:dihydrodipicolinate synthase family protein [Clostridiaceae bacterium]